MFPAAKLTLQARNLSNCSFGWLQQHPLRVRSISSWSLISWQTTGLIPKKPLIFSTRCLKMKEAPRQPLKPQHRWDRVPPSHAIVYESGLKQYINSLYLTVAFTTAATATLGVLRWQQILNNIDYWDGIYFAGVSSVILLILGIAYRFARTVIIRIYHNSDSGQFIGVRRTCLGRLKHVTYYPQDVTVKNSGKLTNRELHHSVDVKIQGQEYYLSAGGFVSPVFYNIHCGGGDGHRDLSKSFVSGPRF